jgi:hypothetical protein
VRAPFLIPLSALLGLALSIPSLSTTAEAEGRANRPDVIAVKDIKKGMKGYGLTVFEGEKPERFDVEVIDILTSFRPRQELILVKTIHPRLEVAKIVGGMSGSPIFLNGKMAGAYAYGWTFGVEPVAGVTPIRSMLDDLDRPLPKMLHGYPLQALPGKKTARVDSERRGRYAAADYSVFEHSKEMAAKVAPVEHRGAELSPVSTPLLLGGMNSGGLQIAEELFGRLGLSPLQAGGSAASEKKGKIEGYVDGGAIGVDLIRGDMSGMGLGTVTRVEGDRLVAFGHPMMEIGVTSLPTTQARVLWFMASHMRSFKMGEGTSPLGALVNDRQASIVVDERIEAPTVGVTLDIKGIPGAPYKQWNFEVAHDKFLTPALLGVALGNGLQSTATERQHVTWSMTSRVKFHGYPAITIEDFGASPAGSPGGSQVAQSNAISAIGEVLNNPWTHARVEKIDVSVSISFGREVATLRAVQLLTPTVDPGGKARIRLHLEPFDGESFTRTVAVPVPEKFAGKSLMISIQPGYAVEPVRAAPENLAELISNLEAGTELPRSLVFSYQSGEGGTAHQGVVTQNLPPSALDVLTSTSSSHSPPQFHTMVHQVEEMPLFVVGSDSITVQVRKARR